jgi:hypothetical protein
LTNGWRIRPAERDHKLTLVGNIFVDGGEGSAFVAVLGPYTVHTETKVSNLVDSSVARLDLSQLQEAIFLDTVNGDDVNSGTPTAPVLTIARAFEAADESNLKAISIDGDVVMDRAVTGWAFRGMISKTTASLDFDGNKLDKCKFEKLTLGGDSDGSDILAEKCVLDSLSDATGTFLECGLIGLVTPGASSKTTLFNCFSDVPGADTPVIDLVAGLGDDLQMRAYSGGVELRNIDQETQKVSVDMVSGHLVLAASCTAGTVVARGVGKLTDLSSGTLNLDKLGFVGMPYDDPLAAGWIYEINRRAMLEAFAAGL